MMNNVMVDLETLGTRAGCAILSIGAVAFDAEFNDLGPEFELVISLDSCLDAGLHCDPDTLEWWSKQSEDARRTLILATGKDGSFAAPLRTALQNFNSYLEMFPQDIKVWGNGADFDNAILQSAYAVVGLKPSWSFYNNRCFRTLKGMVPLAMPRTGVHHNALDDARTQALHAMRILRGLSYVHYMV